MNPKISVIIPVYNTAGYLPRCLDSILGSTYDNLEILCVNDGSTDGSLAVLQAYAEQDPRVLIIDQPNTGVSAARNAGLAACTGEYVAFIDSDDWIDPRYFELLADAALKTGADFVCCREKHIYDTDTAAATVTTLPAFEPQTITLVQAMADPVVKKFCWGRLYSRALLGQFHFDTAISYAEDTSFNIQLLFKTRQIVVLNVPLYFYYVRTDSASHTLPHTDRVNIFDAFLSCFSFAREDDKALLVKEAYKTVFSYRYLSMFEKSAERSARLKTLFARCKKIRHHLPFPMAVIYSVVRCFPLLYRLGRIAADPSLLEWEKNERAKRRARV